MTPFHPPGPASTTAFLCIVVFVLASFVFGVRRAWKSAGRPAGRATLSAALGAMAWVALTSLLVASGWAEASPMPRLMAFFALINILAVTLAFSPVGSRLASDLPIALLVAFQGFRLPLELVLHSWAGQGTIPATMTWTGLNPDILSGLAALLIAPVTLRFPKAAWIANLIGFALLLNVLRVVVLSSPLPFAWPLENPLRLAFHPQFALIGTVCVAGALVGHLVLTRALLRNGSAP